MRRIPLLLLPLTVFLALLIWRASPVPVGKAQSGGSTITLVGPPSCPPGGCAAGQRLSYQLDFVLGDYDASLEGTNVKVCVYIPTNWYNSAAAQLDITGGVTGNTYNSTTCAEDLTPPDQYTLAAAGGAAFNVFVFQDSLNFSFRIAGAATSPGSVLVRVYEKVSDGTWRRTSQVFTPQMTPIPTAGVVYVAGSPNLDAMAAQVSLIKPNTKKAKADAKVAGTLLDKLGITMTEANGVPKEIQYLIKQKHGQKVKAIFEVNKPAEDTVFDAWVEKQKNQDTSILIHGTKCTSVIPILEIGLKIHPVGNFQFSGKAYGDGNYFSEHMQKSLGYTGWDTDKVILVYEVHTGKPFVYDGWFKGNSFNLSYPELSKRGYDSTYVKAGGGLQNSEIIAYKEQQNRIKYIIWLT